MKRLSNQYLAFEEMWNKLKDGASKAWEGIKNIFSNVTNWFKMYLQMHGMV